MPEAETVREEAPAPPPPDRVVVRNLSRRMVTLILTGKHLATTTGSPHRYRPVKLITLHQAKDGTLVPRVRKKLMASSVRVPVGEDVTVGKEVMFCPDLIKAVAEKRIRVVQNPAVPKQEQKGDGK